MMPWTLIKIFYSQGWVTCAVIQCPSLLGPVYNSVNLKITFNLKAAMESNT